MTSSVADALKALNNGAGGRRKVTLAWNGEDVAKIQNSLLTKGEHYKYIEMPLSNYANSNYDLLTVGASRWRVAVLGLQLQRAFVPVAGHRR